MSVKELTTTFDERDYLEQAGRGLRRGEASESERKEETLRDFVVKRTNMEQQETSTPKGRLKGWKTQSYVGMYLFHVESLAKLDWKARTEHLEKGRGTLAGCIEAILLILRPRLDVWSGRSTYLLNRRKINGGKGRGMGGIIFSPLLNRLWNQMVAPSFLRGANLSTRSWN